MPSERGFPNPSATQHILLRCRVRLVLRRGRCHGAVATQMRAGAGLGLCADVCGGLGCLVSAIMYIRVRQAPGPGARASVAFLLAKASRTSRI